MVIHKDYKAPTFENDLAILELEEPIERQPHVVPICMPRDDAGDFFGKIGVVSGWGRLEYGGSVPNILHQVFQNFGLVFVLPSSWWNKE